MEAKGWLQDREHGLEGGYFWQKERALITRLREDSRRENEQGRLRDALGNADEGCLATLHAAGVTSDTLGLLFIIPPIEVAWADGAVSTRERQLILEMAARRGIASDAPTYKDLMGWLNECPSRQFFDAALEAVHVMLEKEDATPPPAPVFGGYAKLS